MLLLLCALARADEVVYDDALSPGWESWSWSGSYDFASIDLAEGAAAIAAEAGAWGALSLHSDTSFDAGGFAAVRFLFAGDGDTVSLLLEADGSGTASEALLVSALADTAPGALTEVILPIEDLGDEDWTRIDWMDATGAGASFVVDEVQLLSALPETTGFTGVEPIGPRRLLLWGSGALDGLEVQLEGEVLGVEDSAVETDPDRVYLVLDRALTAGTLEVTLAGETWTRALSDASATLSRTPTHEISPLIYGLAFPEDYDSYLEALGVTAVRWGGNAVSLYNPYLQVTSAGSDWYFENRASDPAEDWIDAVEAAGALAGLTVPALDWVAKDAESYGYSVAKYGAQQDTDPWNPDAGNGITSGGTPITWNDPDDHATPWTPEDAAAWVAGLDNPPGILFVDNELDIASETHQDVHPDAVTYDELVERWLAHATLLREAAPEAWIAGPSSCCWWFYWNSVAGAEDKAAHDGQDLLPYFLDQVAAADAAAGVRRLDVFDIHYYPDGVYNDETDAETAALRLRSTRSLWDPTYTDEGWIGTDEWATETQPNPNEVQLIPRMRDLLDEHYPGTQLGITEWSWGAEDHLSGGLAVADVLGIFGREDLDLAFYWTAPPSGSPAAAAFSLFRAAEPPFGDLSLPVDGYDPDNIGVYAAQDGAGRTTVVVVNKDPEQDVILSLPGLSGAATVRHFGGQADGEVVEDGSEVVDGAIVVPAWAVVFLAVGDGGGGEGEGEGEGELPILDSAALDTGGEAVKSEGCGCASAPGRGVGLGVIGVVAALVRRRAG